MEQTEKQKIKYAPQHASSWSAKYQSDIKESPEYWKYIPRNSTIPSTKINRRQPSPTEPATSYYSSTTTYKQQKHHTYPTHHKHTLPNTEAPHYCIQSHSKSSKSKTYPGNVAIVRKSRNDETENENSGKYVDEELPGEFTEDNTEENVEEDTNKYEGQGKEHYVSKGSAESSRRRNETTHTEHTSTSEQKNRRATTMEENQEVTGESFDKDYEEQEADDEIDEESDAAPQTRKTNRRIKNEVLKSQQWLRSKEQDPRRLHYQQAMQKLYQGYLPSRYCPAEYDVPEIVSDEELFLSSVPKDYFRRSLAYYQPSFRSRNYDLYEDPVVQRRPRTKPEIETLVDPEFENVKRCSWCGSSSNRKPSSRQNACRFQDPNYTVRTSIGDDIEVRQNPCGRCNMRHNFENIYDIPPSAFSTLKPRRTRDTRSPIFDIPKEDRMIDEFANDYARHARYSRDVPSEYREKPRHPIQTARGAKVIRYPE